VLQALSREVEAVGGTLDDIVSLTQYFTDLRDLPIYSRIRSELFSTRPVSTCVQVVELLPTPLVRLEVQAIAYLPQSA
jgi:enamine deaminase RidA (YjgF/YER057c/UK114 family)